MTRALSLCRVAVARLARACLLAVVVLVAMTGRAGADERTGVSLYLVGDSTVKNGSGKGDHGLWGWGQVLQPHFDYAQVTVKNRALGGRSSRTYLTEGLWQKTLDCVQPGDFVFLQFGHNDGGQMFAGDRPRASIKGAGDDAIDGVVENTGKAETVRSYGWYLRRYIADARSKGATPVVLSPVPRNIWTGGRVARAAGDYGGWAKEAALAAGAPFIDLNEIVATRYEGDGQPLVAASYFTNGDHTHTTRLGAEVSAECVVAGIRSSCALGLAECLLPSTHSARGRVDMSGESGDGPLVVTIRAPEGNHLVRVRFGSATESASTSVEAELRRRLCDTVVTAAGEFLEKSFLINTRTPVLPNDGRLRLKPRELTREAAAWDAALTLTFSGDRPRVACVEVLPAPEDTVTVYLLGDSTVSDQYGAPWASWGQKIPRYFGPRVAVANHAESGETIAAAWSAGRCDKILDCLRPGDWLLVQFGHNDMKSSEADAVSRYQADLRRLVRAAAERGGRPVLVTSMERMAGVSRDTLGKYPNAVRQVASEEGVPLIDLHTRSKRLYRDLGDRLPAAFQDATHHNDYGAELLAACVVDGIATSAPELSAYLNSAPRVRP